MGDVPTYVLERAFDAPRELVWRAWTEPDLLARWYGPNVETINHRHELNPGGVWLCEMKLGRQLALPEGGVHGGERAPERLVWLHSNTDAQWSVAPSPMMPNWPLVLLTTVTFAEEGGGTRVAPDLGAARGERGGSGGVRGCPRRPGPGLGRRHGTAGGAAAGAASGVSDPLSRRPRRLVAGQTVQVAVVVPARSS